MSDDKVVPLAKPKAVANTNDMIIKRLQGEEMWEPTAALRWNNGVLEQMHRGASSGATRWEQIPDVRTMPQI